MDAFNKMALSYGAETVKRLLAVLAAALAAVAVPAAEPDLKDYRTAATAIRAKTGPATATSSGKAGYLGVRLATDAAGKVAVADVAIDSPAARADLRVGDFIVELDGTPVASEGQFLDRLAAKSPGETVKLTLQRGGTRVIAAARLDSPSHPLLAGKLRPLLGVQVAPVINGEGATIEHVEPGSSAERAELKVGTVLLKVDDTVIKTQESLAEVIAKLKPGDPVTLTLAAGGKAEKMRVAIGSEKVAEEQRPASFGPGSRYWTRPTFRLGIIGVEFSDIKHNPKIPPAAWQDAMFSHGTYTDKSVTGQKVHGSMYDYYLEQSYGALKIEGRAFDYVEVSKKRADYTLGRKADLLTEALDMLLARDPDALKDLDGVFFIYAGGRFPVPRGSLYWPHRASVSFRGKRWPYFICPEGGQRMTSNSVFCHEFGHMLGLPDLYARPEIPGMEGVGVWSAMANQVGNGRPQHFDAWSKAKLGWLKPVVIDPAVKQKLLLAPVEDSPNECFQIPIRPDGREYLLLENRRKKGFDASLPAEGLLIWRVVAERPILEEAHGIQGPSGPRLFVDRVPYPGPANDSFTPYTTPASRSQLGGGTPVYITNITRLADGRISFQIGYEFH